MSEQDSGQVTTLQRPTTDNRADWKAYWQARGQSWRTEPEVDSERQKYLARRRAIAPDIEKGRYPFRDIKLSRADVEWLLATHENGRGPVNWDDESQRERTGLDLRGANLRQVDLRALPLACSYGGFYHSEWDELEEWAEEAEVHGEAATIHMEGANLHLTHLEGVNFGFAHLENASLMDAHLEKAFLYEAHLEGATLQGTHLEDAWLMDAYLEHAFLNFAHLEGASLGGAHMENALLQCAYLNQTNLRYAYLAGTEFYEDHMEGADFEGAHLEGASLLRAHLEEANLSETHLEGTDIRYAHLAGSILRRASLDKDTKLDNTVFSNQHMSALLADVCWGDVNVAVVDWSRFTILGDELRARQHNNDDGKPKDRQEYLRNYNSAVRTYRQLAVVLRNQGLNEDASRFAYRAQLMQRKVFWCQRRFGQYLFSLFLDLLAGYGYKPWRSFVAYLIVIAAFAITYFLIGRTVGPPLSPLGAWVFSMTSFHGRGFFPGGIGLDDPLTVVAALEAFVGLLIEVTFIATLTQRLFGK